MENHTKVQINKEQITTASEKKAWTAPELTVINKKVVEGGYFQANWEDSNYRAS